MSQMKEQKETSNRRKTSDPKKTKDHNMGKRTVNHSKKRFLSEEGTSRMMQSGSRVLQHGPRDALTRMGLVSDIPTDTSILHHYFVS
jgi:hypothetical protein